MALKKTGYTSTTAKNYVINAATVYTGVTYDGFILADFVRKL